MIGYKTFWDGYIAGKGFFEGSITCCWGIIIGSFWSLLDKKKVLLDFGLLILNSFL